MRFFINQGVSLELFNMVYITHKGLLGVWLMIFPLNLILIFNWPLVLLFLNNLRKFGQCAPKAQQG
jgi:hypothetical protein